MDLILASTSPYRQLLLKRLQIPFRCEAPDVDEARLAGESASTLADRLARAKAQDVARKFPDALVIGSDQVASIDGRCIGKPGTHDVATKQLLDSSGKQVDFYTGLAVIGKDAGFIQSLVEQFSVVFRTLTGSEIEVYLKKEQPYDCAGSFKCEGLGIALFEKMIGNDPTTLEGLPLIATCRLLTAAGLPILK
ncbi:MAG: nucleoside triphosphate pyrophosphatase [Halioglobus sp.]